MLRQPDIQYIQMYQYGSTAYKLQPSAPVKKNPYQLPEQVAKPRPVRRTLLEPLSLCAIALACVMLLTMVVGMLQVGELTSRHRELENHIDVLQAQRADLQKSYEDAYDLHQVEIRARQIGLVAADEAVHVPMGKLETVPREEPGLAQRVKAVWDELFAKAP